MNLRVYLAGRFFPTPAAARSVGRPLMYSDGPTFVSDSANNGNDERNDEIRLAGLSFRPAI